MRKRPRPSAEGEEEGDGEPHNCGTCSFTSATRNECDEHTRNVHTSKPIQLKEGDQLLNIFIDGKRREADNRLYCPVPG
jgi:hypothetical protein